MTTSESYNFFGCIQPLLEALGWHGSPRRIFETAPYLKDHMSLVEFRNMMINLGYNSTRQKGRFYKIRKKDVPCLFIDPQQKHVFVVHNITDTDYIATNCHTGEAVSVPLNTKLYGEFIRFMPATETQEPVPGQKSWLMQIAHRFQSFLWPLLGWTFFTTILGLMLPLFVRSIYDFVIPTQSRETLVYLGIGLGAGLLCMHIIHVVKERAMAYIGARLDMIISTEVMKKLLFLPVPYTEGSSVASQVTRIRQFDTIRELFTGPLFQVAIDAPFLILYIIVLAAIAGPVALVPIVVIIIYAIMGFIFFPIMRESTNKLSNATQDRRSFLIESVSNIKTVKLLGGEKTWIHRFKNVCSKLAHIQKDADALSNLAMNLSQMLIKISGIVAIVWSAARVMDGSMTTGSLIAVVLLIWRALSPIQTLFMFLGRTDVIISTMTQLNRLMMLPSEHKIKTETDLKFQGLIRIANAGFRYPNDTNPAIQGVTLEARPGEMVAIIGQNGSGKSTLIKLLLGFYPAQVGTVSIDGIDIRQYDPIQLRQAIAYVPHQIQFFHGTIAQNLRLAAPDATDNQIIAAIEKSGLSEDLFLLPHGINTPMNDEMIHRFSSGFLQKLSLARAYVRRSKILILDEPGNTLDHESDQKLHEHLKSLKGEKTVIIVTHRPSLVKLADRVLALHEGQMRVFGPTDKVLEILAGNTGTK